MPDLSKVIHTFDGEAESAQVREWLDNLNPMSLLHRWPLSYALETARAHLKGGALHWFRMLASELNTWERFEASFKKTFISAKSLTER